MISHNKIRLAALAAYSICATHAYAIDCNDSPDPVACQAAQGGSGQTQVTGYSNSAPTTSSGAPTYTNYTKTTNPNGTVQESFTQGYGTANGIGTPTNSVADKAKQKSQKIDEDSTGPCVHSDYIAANGTDAMKTLQGLHQCQSTYDFIETSKLANTISQAGGAMSTNVAGAIGSYKAQSAGTQAAVMGQSANIQEMAGGMQTTLGLGNMATGVYQIYLSRQHHQTAQDLSHSKADSSGTEGEAAVNSKTVAAAQAEQAKVEQTSMMGGVQSLITGTQMTVAGGLAMAVAAQEKKLANTLANAQGSNYQLSGTSAASAVPTSGGTTAITPSGTDSSPATATGDLASKNVPSITPAVNPDNTNGGGGSGPAPGTFAQGNPSAAAGSNGAPVGAPGGLSAAKPDGDNPQAHLAESRQNTGYNSGAGSGYVAGNVAADKSADLGFLANLLPKPQEEMGKNGILDYGNRSPASAGPYSFLGKDVNIFKRISDRTTAKIKSGDIGI